MSDGVSSALDSRRLNTAFSAGAFLLAAIGTIAALNGWLTIGSLNSKDYAQVREQVTSIDHKVDGLALKFEGVPRPDQLLVIERNLSALNSRMDLMDARQRQDRDEVVRLQALIGQRK